LKLGRTPDEFLSSVDSAQIGELLAYFVLQNEDIKSKVPEDDVEANLREIFGRH